MLARNLTFATSRKPSPVNGAIDGQSSVCKTLLSSLACLLFRSVFLFLHISMRTWIIIPRIGSDGFSCYHGANLGNWCNLGSHAYARFSGRHKSASGVFSTIWDVSLACHVGTTLYPTSQLIKTKSMLQSVGASFLWRQANGLLYLHNAIQ
jgi:hypothetical protein